MIAAQVALNYGLFCDEIVFQGSFDRHDRRFIEEMASNTAREIYVKKFLEPNPFLLGEAARLPAIKQKSYLASKLVFDGDEPSPRALGGGGPSPARLPSSRAAARTACCRSAC